MIRCLKDSPCDDVNMNKITKNTMDKLHSDLKTSNEVASQENKYYKEEIDKLNKELEVAKNK